MHRIKFRKYVRVNNTQVVNQGFMSLVPQGLRPNSPQPYFYEFLPSQVINKVPSVFFFVLCLWIQHLDNKRRHIKHMLLQAALVNVFSETTIKRRSTLQSWNESWEPEGFSDPTGEQSTFFSSMLVIRQRLIYQNLSSLKQHVLLKALSRV